ncbi:hypothetical protein QJQ45_017841 [Haematococcus lacustris]|nr:hypothetical protein QJQ45_017841 [Haematococcus lacustris]
MPPNVPKLRRLTLYQHWKGAEPWQRRNMVLASIMLVWAGVLMVDMHNLKQDPVLRAKLKLDDPDTLTLRQRWGNWVDRTLKMKDEDW